MVAYVVNAHVANSHVVNGYRECLLGEETVCRITEVIATTLISKQSVKILRISMSNYNF